MDVKGTVVIPAVFQNAGEFSEGLAAARRDGDFGYIDASCSYFLFVRSIKRSHLFCVDTGIASRVPPIRWYGELHPDGACDTEHDRG